MVISDLREEEIDLLHQYEGPEYELLEGVNATVGPTPTGPSTVCGLYVWKEACRDMLVTPLEPWDQEAFERNDLEGFAAMLRGEYR
jgi:hypothetical protein